MDGGVLEAPGGWAIPLLRRGGAKRRGGLLDVCGNVTDHGPDFAGLVTSE